MSTEAIPSYDVLSQLQPTFSFPVAFQSLKNVIMSELLVPSVTVFNQYCDISIYLRHRQYILLYKLFRFLSIFTQPKATVTMGHYTGIN